MTSLAWPRISAAARTATGATVLTQVVGLGAGLVSSVLLARALGAQGRGDVAAVMTTLTLLSWVVFLGLPNAAGFLSTRHRSGTVTVAATGAVVLGVLLGAALWFVAPHLLAGHDPATVTGLRAAAVLLPLVGLGLCGVEVLYAEGRLMAWNVLRSLPLVVPAVGIALLAGTGDLTLVGVLVVYLAATATCGLLGALVVATRCTWRPAWERGRAVLAYSLPRWVSASSDAVTARLDQLFMVVLSTPAELGRYAVVVTAVAVANPVSSAIGMMVYPRTRNAAAAATADHDWRRARGRALLVSGVVGTGVAVVAPGLVGVVFGPDFEGLRTVVVLLVLAQVLNDRWAVDVSYYGGAGRPATTVVPAWVGAAATAVGLLVLGLDGHLTAVDAAAMTLGGNVLRWALLGLRARRVGVPLDGAGAHHG